MRVSGISSNRDELETVRLLDGVLGVSHVEAGRIWYTPTGSTRERSVVLVFYDRLGTLNRIHGLLRTPGAELPDILGGLEPGMGRLLWSKLFRDIGTGSGTGRYSALRNRKVHFKSFFKWLDAPTSDYWSVLAEQGERAWPDKVPTFADWKKRLHFPQEQLPSSEELGEAARFLELAADPLTEAEERHRHNARWRGMDQLPTQFWNWVRGDAKQLAKEHGLTAGGFRAATLLSYAARLRISNRLATELMRRLPPDLLDAPAERVFRAMWLAEDGNDPDGRHDVPLMASPVLSSAIDYCAEIRADGTIRSKENIIPDILAFVESDGRYRNRGLDIALGFGSLCPLWIDDERRREREKSRRAGGAEQRHAGEVEALDERPIPAKPRKTPPEDN